MDRLDVYDMTQYIYYVSILSREEGFVAKDMQAQNCFNNFDMVFCDMNHITWRYNIIQISQHILFYC